MVTLTIKEAIAKIEAHESKFVLRVTGDDEEMSAVDLTQMGRRLYKFYGGKVMSDGFINTTRDYNIKALLKVADERGVAGNWTLFLIPSSIEQYWRADEREFDWNAVAVQVLLDDRSITRSEINAVVDKMIQIDEIDIRGPE